MQEVLKVIFRRFRRMLRPERRWGQVVWSDLKVFQRRMNWRSGIYEDDQFMETRFNLGEGVTVTCYYFMVPHALRLDQDVVQGFNEDQATDVFVLATHFNNYLNFGKLIVGAKEARVIYRMDLDIAVAYVHPEEIERAILRHQGISKEAMAAYRRLLEEGEPPALIIADLLKSMETPQGNGSET